MDVSSFFQDLTYEIDAALSTYEDGALPHELFLTWAIDQITEVGETEDLALANYEAKGRAVDGYYYSDHDGRLDLYLTDYRRAASAYTVYKAEVSQSLKRVSNFFAYYKKANAKSLEIEHPAFDLVETIRKSEINLVRVFLITDGTSTLSKIDDDEAAGVKVQYQVWDSPRFIRNKESGVFEEDIEVVVKEYGFDGLPCSTAAGSKSVKTLQCVFPGDFVADLYRNFSSRLLERNVRAFLSFRTKVNKGILATIEEDPANFLAFNNGLTITTQKIALSKDKTRIQKMLGVQIVNGGQTTNSLFRAKYSEGLDLSKVFVPVKLCVLSPDTMETFAPLIADFANSQNAVRRSDISSSNPFYRDIEKSSRSILAPAVGGAQRETKWFFERVRDQYADELSRKNTPAQKKRFENEYPRKQKFDKADLAQCWGVWYQEVEDASLGTEKYNPQFLENIKNDKRKFDSSDPEGSFRRLIAMVIIRKKVLERVRKKKFGHSYPGNTTDYTIAVISNCAQMRINFEEIWQNQNLTEEFFEAVDFVAPIVGDTIKDLCYKHGVIARELAKGKKKVDGQTLFQILLGKITKLPVDRLSTAGKQSQIKRELKSDAVEELEEEIKLVEEAGSALIWEVATWARETNNLQPWQRGILGSVGKLLDRGRSPSIKQARQVVKALDEAKAIGFSSEQ